MLTQGEESDGQAVASHVKTGQAEQYGAARDALPGGQVGDEGDG